MNHPLDRSDACSSQWACGPGLGIEEAGDPEQSAPSRRLHRVRHRVDERPQPCELAHMDIDLDHLPDFTSMPLEERLRFWANLGAKTARVRGNMAMSQAEMEAGAMEIGVMLLGVHGDTVEWKGRPLEPVLAERLVFEDDELLDDDEDQDDDDGDQHEPGPWPVNVEKDLFERLRAANFDLDELLATHARPCMREGAKCSRPSGG